MPADFRAAARESSSVMDLARVSSPGVSDAIVGVNDLLEVTIASGRGDEKPNPVLVRVAGDGTVDVPVIGVTPVAGLDVYDASQNIVKSAVDRGIYVQPYVTVEIESKAVKRVTVLGAVNDPGVHELPYGNCDLVTALAAAGGLSDEAGTEVEIIRQPTLGISANESVQPNPQVVPNEQIQLSTYQSLAEPPGHPTQSAQTLSNINGPQVLKLDLAESQGGGLSDTRLSDRDVVMITPRKKEIIYVTGLVTSPGQFELPLDQDIHLLDAIAMAGGQDSPVADKVLVIRRIKNREEPVVIVASLSAAKKNGLENLRLTAGDTISIEQTPVTAVVDTFTKLFRLSFGIAGRTTAF